MELQIDPRRRGVKQGLLLPSAAFSQGGRSFSLRTLRAGLEEEAKLQYLVCSRHFQKDAI